MADPGRFPLNMYSTPILILLFNRPDTTRKVMEVVRQLKPSRLFVAADGPRRGNEGDLTKCEEARKAVTESVDWPCEVKTLFRTENKGCRNAVSEGISWFFGHVEEGVILEDDTLPDPSFFTFCSNMLERYRHESRVMHIAGINFQFGRHRGEASYYFSKYAHIWGWASWRRAWQQYDPAMSDWPTYKKTDAFRSWCMNGAEVDFWTEKLDLTYAQLIDTWDYQWVYAIMKNKGLCVMPNWNLVSNIGFRSDGTHTHDNHSRFSEMKVHPYNFPDKSPALAWNQDGDRYTFEEIFNPAAPLEDTPEPMQDSQFTKLYVRMKTLIRRVLTK